MNAIWLRRVFKASLIPFINELFPTGHRLYKNNDPKHRSEYISVFFEERGINWWPTTPKSCDLNLIENIWGSLKQYLCTTYKPGNLGVEERYPAILDDTDPTVVSVLHETHTQSAYVHVYR